VKKFDEGRSIFIPSAGFASTALACYCLVRAFDVFGTALEFPVWFSRAVVSTIIGVIGLQIGSSQIGLV
jgi:hypothetical protein